jgi:hypothetical protein
MKRSRTFRYRLTFIGPVVLGSLFLAGCGSDKGTTTETTISTESADSILDETTLAPIETTVAPETTLAAEETSDASETTAPSDTAAGETTPGEPVDTALADPSAALDAALVSFVTSLGVEDPGGVAKCIRKQDPTMTLDALNGGGGSISPGLFRGLARCGDGAFAKQAAGGIDTVGLTEDQKQCLAQSTLDVVADSDDATITQLTLLDGTKDFPADIKAKITAVMVTKCKVTQTIADEVINDDGSADAAAESAETTVPA